MKQQSIMLNGNCQLIQCTHNTDLLSNLKGLLDSMIIRYFCCDAKCLMFTELCQNHQTFINCSLVHNFHIAGNNNCIVIYTWRTLLVMNISYFPNLHYWLPLLENLGTVKLSCLKHCQRLFVDNIFSRNFMP